MNMIEEIKKRVEEIQSKYNNSNIDVPHGVQTFVFYAPLREIDAPELCGLIFPTEDFEKVKERAWMWRLNTVESPRQYVGVDWEFQKPIEVLQYGINNLDKSPQKIMYGEKGFYLTSEKLLSNPMGLTHLTVIMTGFADTLNDFVTTMDEIKQELEKLLSDNRQIFK